MCFPWSLNTIRSPEDSVCQLSPHDQLYHHSCSYLTPSLRTASTRVYFGTKQSAGTRKGQESPRSRDRLCSTFALCDTEPLSMIKVPGYYGDMNINDPVIKTPGKELYLHLIQDCPCSPTQPLSNSFIFMGFSFSFVK